MGATISVGGAVITVDTKELGEAMRQLAPWLNQPPAVRALRPQDAWPLVATAPAPVAPLPSLAPITAAAPEHSTPGLALSLFKAIRDHRASGGLRPDEVMKLLGATHPKGTGSRMQSINKLLREMGADPAAVYRNDKNALGMRSWTAGPDLNTTIDLLESNALSN